MRDYQLGLPLLAAFHAAGGQILFKLGATGSRGMLDFLNPAIFGGLALYGVSTLLWIYALSRLPLVVVFPFTALTFVIVYVCAYFILGEVPSWQGYLGVFCVLVGLALIATSSAGLT